MKTIAKIFIGALIATGGIAFYMNWKKKQAAKSTSAPVAGGGASSAASTTSTVTPTTSATSTSAPVTNTGFAPAATNPAASTTSYSSTTGKYSFQFAMKENSKNQTIISYQPKTDTFVNGQKVKIVTGPSALIGKTGTIWYIYDFTSGGRLAGAGQNLYLDIPWSDSFAGTVGTFDKI